MAELFCAEIVFLSAVEGETLPPELRKVVADEEGNIDTTRTAQFLPAPGKGKREDWRQWNSVYDGEGEVTEESPERLVVVMPTKRTPDLEWLSAVAAAFPTVRTVLRGEERSNPWTVHVGYQGKETLFERIETDHDERNLDLRVQLDFEYEFRSAWDDLELDLDDGECKVMYMLNDDFVSTEMLEMMQNHLDLTPEQLAMLEAHPNYVPGFVADPQAWETFQPDLEDYDDYDYEDYDDEDLLEVHR